MNRFKKLIGYIRSYARFCINIVLHSVSRPTVGVVILSCSNTPEITTMTQRAIDSIMLQNSSDIRTVVVESGPDVVYNRAVVIKPNITFNYNQFLKIGIRHLLSAGQCDYVLILNNDILAYPSAIDNLVRYGLESCSPVNPLNVEQSGVTKLTFGYSVRYHVVGWGLCLRSSLFGKLSLDDLFPSEFSFYHQDNYFSHVIDKFGVIHGVVPHSKIVHYEGVSHSIRPDLLNNNSEAMFVDKTSKV